MKKLSTYSMKQLKEKIEFLDKRIMEMVREIREMKKEYMGINKARKENFNTNLDKVIEDIKLCYKVDIHSRMRDVPAVAFRSCLMHILLENCEISLAETGKLLGRKDHSTVSHARDKVTDLLSIGDEYYKDVYDKVYEIYYKYFEN